MVEGDNRLSYLYQRKSSSSNVRTIVPSASSSAVLLNIQLGEFFKTTIGVRQGCLLSPILFNFLVGPKEPLLATPAVQCY